MQSLQARRTARRIALAGYVGLNVGLILYGVRFSSETIDWRLWSALPEAIASGNPHAPNHELPFVWSPVAAWLMAGVSFMGYWPWVLAHVAAVLLLRDWRFIALVLVSWGFWADASQGNVFTFLFVAAALGLQGGRGWAVLYLAFLFLMPRPVQVPIGAWLLWRQPVIRLPVLGVFAAHAAIVLATGLTGEWLDAMLSYTESPFNIGPSFFLGSTWLLIGVPLAVMLTKRGWVGWAGLAVSPYVLAQYLILPLVDLMPRARKESPKLAGIGPDHRGSLEVAGLEQKRPSVSSSR